MHGILTIRGDVISITTTTISMLVKCVALVEAGWPVRAAQIAQAVQLARVAQVQCV